MNVNRIAEIINEKGYEAIVNEFTKGSIVKTAISVGTGNVRPAIYPDQFAEDGLTDEEIADKAIELYEKNKTPDFDTSNIMKEDYIKENMFVTVRRPIIDNSYTKAFLDMQLVLNVKVSELENGEFASYKVQKELAEALGFTEDIFDEAINNTQFCLSTMGDAIKAIASDEEIPDCGMYVVSNELRSYGAAVIYNMKFLESLAGLFDGDLVIIPSSIHEVIVLKFDAKTNISELNEMVKQVNYTSVEETEQLSDHVYIFMKDSKVLSF